MPTNPSPTRQWVSLSQAAEHLGVSDRTLRRMIAAGEVPAYGVGPRLVRLDLAEVDATACAIPTTRSA